ncbi:hypothetical protein GCM10023084_07570 [Streptomyces lacrimifluminis]|uniref:Uncharacterized protein n=1 Tax=Streptomyces lacrimifluminis TaxID=1500077 RepID=A0A917KSR5_9ACTN|nr:hypothetical protein GCM10012282_22310 [Streptomyces lacrimifluminis]
MLQCTAVAVIPPTHAVVGDPPKPSYVACVLAENHGEMHASFLEAIDGSAVWFVWCGLRGRFLLMPWCEAPAENGDACTFHRDHPAGHSWEVTDPTIDALCAELARRHPHLYPDRESNED